MLSRPPKKTLYPRFFMIKNRAGQLGAITFSPLFPFNVSIKHLLYV